MLNSQIESILFVSDKPLTYRQIGKLVGRSGAEIEVVIENLKLKYNTDESGIHILTTGREVQMVSNAKNKKVVEGLLKEEVASELTRPQLETLTIIAYRGPITKLTLEQIRGVNCSLILRNLLIKGLIEMEEDKLIDNNKYIISMNFLKHLGVNSVEELPDYEELSRPLKITEV